MPVRRSSPGRRGFAGRGHRFRLAAERDRVLEPGQLRRLSGHVRLRRSATDQQQRQRDPAHSAAKAGPDLSNPATEETPLAAHTYQYGMQKMESDRVVQQRAPALRGCSVYILRPQVFAGDGIENCFIEAFRGVPGGSSKRAERMRAQGKRLPCLLPSGKKYLSNRIQFVHIDDVARLVAFILKKTDPEAQRLTVLNVAGRGTPLTFEQCINIAQAKLVRIPTERLFDWVLQFFWKMRISTIPPDVMPYLLSDSVIETARLQEFLNAEYKDVIKYPIAEAFAECFK